jgi:ABC-type oligopeptide transport system, periplasmic component
VEFLGSYPILERVFLFYKPSLERLGITVSVRTVDEAQYENRLRNWDFDIVTYAWGETRLPGNELRDYWGSEAATRPGSGNVIGIENPAVDAMIGHVLLAKHYDDLVAAVRALDRVLLWNHYVVPQWSYNRLRVARWDRFSHPDPLPKYDNPDSPACGGGMPTRQRGCETAGNGFWGLECGYLSAQHRDGRDVADD